MWQDPKPIRPDFWKDGPDAIPVTTRTRVRPNVPPARVRFLIINGIDYSDAWPLSEIYRMHTRPELYPDWLRERMDEDFIARLDREHKVSFDCDTCHMAVLVDTHHDPCPNCT